MKFVLDIKHLVTWTANILLVCSLYFLFIYSIFWQIKIQSFDVIRFIFFSHYNCCFLLCLFEALPYTQIKYILICSLSCFAFTFVFNRWNGFLKYVYCDPVTFFSLCIIVRPCCNDLNSPSSPRFATADVWEALHVGVCARAVQCVLCIPALMTHDLDHSAYKPFLATGRATLLSLLWEHRAASQIGLCKRICHMGGGSWQPPASFHLLDLL